MYNKFEQWKNTNKTPNILLGKFIWCLLVITHSLPKYKIMFDFEFNIQDFHLWNWYDSLSTLNNKTCD